jgi:two-component system sensor histidine kinase CpxA
MAGLVNELLSFSKASLGGAAVKLQPVNVAELVERAVHRERSDAVKIETSVSQELTAQADPELLVRSLSNLLRNAVRHAGAAGPITVNAGALENAVEITVADCGPGVPEAALQKIFDPFFRLDESRARDTGGVGLGLTIVKTCVESCGGTVACRNRQPSGLEVTVRLQTAAAWG